MFILLGSLLLSAVVLKGRVHSRVQTHSQFNNDKTEEKEISHTFNRTVCLHIEANYGSEPVFNINVFT